jgi:TRAP transporter 4TM/12TM fusion protein
MSDVTNDIDIDIEPDESVDLEEIKKLDSESNFRSFDGWAKILIAVLAISMSLFQVYTSGFGLLNGRIQRATHFAFALALIFLIYPAYKKSPQKRFTWYDICLAVLGIGINLYLIVNFEALAHRAGAHTNLDFFVSVVAIFLVLEAGRRVIGIDLPILGIIFLVYATRIARYLPIFAHGGYSLKYISTYMFYTLEGIYSTPLSVAATYVFLFVLFGVLAEKTGLGKLFIDIALALAGRSTGGPAKVAVISSGLMGSINGSSIANTVTTGAFTIPLMKKTGYKAQFAGAVEAAASTGGQIMPPVMGAAAFIMSEFLGIPYVKIIVAAIIPALLYYLAVGVIVHLEAAKYKLKGLERVPVLWKILKEKWYLLVPLLIIIIKLVGGYTPLNAGFWGIICMVSISFATGFFSRVKNLIFIVIPIGITIWLSLTGQTFLDAFCYGILSMGVIGVIAILLGKANNDHFTIGDLTFSLEKGAKSALGVTASCAAVGFIVGSCTLTGLGLSFAGATVDLSQSIVNGFSSIGLNFMATDGVLLFFTLFFTMVACTILGSGIPTTATYIILAMIAAPALTKLGVSPLASHMFVLYFGVVADLTPPVALAAYAGAGIAGSNPFKTGFTAVKLAIAGFVVPFVFVYSETLLLQDVQFVPGAIAVVTAIMGIFALGSGVEGYIFRKTNVLVRILMFFAALMLLVPGLTTDLIGAAVLVLLLLFQWFFSQHRKHNLETV